MIAYWIAGGAPSFAALLVEFAVTGLAVLFFARKLSHWADILERVTSISAMMIGGIFLAIVTSLPEAVATIGSAFMGDDVIALGVANLFGSNAFNLLIVVLLDAVYREGPLLAVVDQALIKAAGGGAVIMLLAGVAVGLSQTSLVTGAPLWMGLLFSVVIIATAYFMVSRVKSGSKSKPSVSTKDTFSKAHVVVRLCLYAAALVGVASLLLRVCDLMAVTPIHFGASELVLGRTVTGTFLLSAATSLPEVFVCMAALRLGQKDMAVANLLGSNMVNMLFLPFMHAASWNPDFYQTIEADSIAVLLAMALVMTGLVALGLRARPRKATMRVGWDSLGILATYLLGAALILKMGLSI